MSHHLLRAGALSCALLASTALTAPASAQILPRFESIDANGVDLISGDMTISIPEGSAGSGDGAVSLTNVGGTRDQWDGLLYRTTIGGVSTMVVELNRISYRFTQSGSTWIPLNSDGSTLVAIGGANGVWRYTAPDGTKIDFETIIYEFGDATFYPVDGPGCASGIAGTCGIPTSITRPNGMTFTFNWDVVRRCGGRTFPCPAPVAYFRLSGVTSGAGYSFTNTYATNTPGGNAFTSNPPVPDWFKRTGATIGGRSVSFAFPSSGVTEITDAGGRTWRLTNSGSSYSIRRPGSSTDDIVYTRSGGAVTAATVDGVTTSYARTVVGTIATTTITDALGHNTVVVADLAKGRITSVTDANGNETIYTYDSNSRLTRVTRPEGDYTAYTYDARGNVTEVRQRDKSGNAANDIVTSASYPPTCTNVLTCNRPTSTTDARGNTTDYTYDPTHGGVLTVTWPAPSGTGARPQTRYSYTNVGGAYRVTGISACATGAAPSCVGTSDESRVVIGYDSHGNVTSVERRSGNASGAGAVSTTTTATYDSLGDLLTVDGPLSGTADTVRYRWNDSRELIGVVGPDPDGGGALKHRAVRITRDAFGRVTGLEQGTVNSQSDIDWSAFSSLQAVELEYDSHHRPVVQRLTDGSTTYALTQTSYDANGRVQCVAQRMNPGQFATASLPASACTLDTMGNYGPDRITRTTYDAAGKVTLVETGYGVAGVQADEVATTWTDNGRVATVTDAEGNRTTYEYDGHDRLVKTRMPSPTTAGTSSTTDYEQLTLDDAGNVTSRRLRDGTSIGYTYDRLNRVTGKDLPGSELDVSYTYDLLGHMLSASTSAQTLTFTYDALGRNLTQQGPLGTASYQYDAAGRRTRLTYPGTGLYVTYDYDAAGGLTHIRENSASSGAGVLATWAYDNLGRRTTLTRGNGTTTTYGYDAVSRLISLVQNLAGSASDVTLGFDYNPASQITSLTRSNDAYAWTDHYAVTRNYTPDGLNRYGTVATAGGSTIYPSYDTRGNLTAAGGPTYSYSSENLLTAASGGVSLAYDPLTRLYQTADGTTTTRFAYDGADMIAEYNSLNALQRRYVFDPASGAPLLWYEGTGTSDRRWYHTDERGSVIATSNSSGTMLGINSYDEFGIPASTNTGRFGYTGQAWLPELGMWYYRARIYSPTLGRFMQTDPIGYGDGMNLYAYVGNDPVNFADPSGLDQAGMQDIIVTGHINWWQRDLFGRQDIFREPLTFARAPAGNGGGGGTSPQPQRVNVDPSCAGNAAANDPVVQAAALAALNLASANDAEFGFFVSENIFSSGYSTGPAFSSGDQRGITRRTVDRNQAGFFRSLFNGTYAPSLFVHTHQNNPPPSPLSRTDQTSAAQRGITYAAIDRAGNLTCSRN